MKEKLFKFFFPRKAGYIKVLEKENSFLEALLEEKKPKVDLLAPLDFAHVDESAKPPHPLVGLDDAGRKNALARLESIYSDDWYVKFRDYAINVWGNNSFQVEPDESKMYRGRYAVIGIRSLDDEFKNAHNEFVDSRKRAEDFDPLETLPE